MAITTASDSGGTLPKMVIWGAAGQARVAGEIIRSRGDYELIGFLDDVNPQRRGEAFAGLKVLGGADRLDDLHRLGVHHLAVVFGKCCARLRVAERVQNLGYEMPTMIHPDAAIAEGTQIGAGTVINANSSVGPQVRIGRNVIVGAGVTISHDSTIGDGVLISNGVNLAGVVRVGRASWIGTGASVRDRIEIGERALIGVGAAVVQDVPSGVVAYGVPARVRREVGPDEP